jgi:hypothetical protein
MNEQKKRFDPCIVVYAHHTFVHLPLFLLDNDHSEHWRISMRSPSVNNHHQPSHEMNPNKQQINIDKVQNKLS